MNLDDKFHKDKLFDLLDDKLKEFLIEDFTRMRKSNEGVSFPLNTNKKWDEYLESMGVKTSSLMIQEKDFVCIKNPQRADGSRPLFLLIPKDVAEKILVLGLP